MNRRIPQFHPEKLRPGQTVTTAHREEAHRATALQNGTQTNGHHSPKIAGEAQEEAVGAEK